MKPTVDDDAFYIGYLPKAPHAVASFTRKVVVASVGVALLAATLFAVTLRYAGQGQFDFGHPREVRGVVRCGDAPRLEADGADYLLVGYGKHRVAPELCGAAGQETVVRGTLIQRDGKRLLEVVSPPEPGARAFDERAAVPLGRFTLRGEIVDSKCYFGVMNPAEGRTHRACAELCLRGGVPAVFVARDATGAVAHLIVTGRDGTPVDDALFRWIGEPVEATGEVTRRGDWLVWHVDPASLHPALQAAKRDGLFR